MDEPELDLTTCPDPSCAAPAEVLDRWQAASTDGPVTHLKTLCARRHVFTAPIRLRTLRSDHRTPEQRSRS